MTTVKVIDHGWQAMKKRLESFSAAYTKVGYPMESPKTAEKAERSPFTIGEIAIVQEYGSETRRIPPRPTMGPAFDDNLESNQKLARLTGKQFLQGKMSLDSALGTLGEVGVNQVTAKINSLWLPELAEATLRARVSRQRYSIKPLVESGQMKSSVTHVEVIK
jgi:hypothetical protein